MQNVNRSNGPSTLLNLIEPLQALRDTVDWLNQGSGEVHANVLGMVNSWMSADKHFIEMKGYSTDALRMRMDKSFKARLYFPPDGSRARLVLGLHRHERMLVNDNEALFRFAQLILNDRCDLMGGPCDRCNKFFVKNSMKQKRYCSRTCSRDATAALATKERSEDGRKNKLQAVSRAIQQWRSRRGSSTDWIEWVIGKHPEISKNWITRRLNDGSLQAPVRGDV